MEKDKCVMCGKETPYKINTHIESRIGYIEGMGQLCLDCFDGKSDYEVICIPKRVIIETPNDMELGAKIRNLIYMK